MMNLSDANICRRQPRVNSESFIGLERSRITVYGPDTSGTGGR